MTDAQLQVIASDLQRANADRDEAVSIARGLLMILESVVGAIGPQHHAAYRAGQELVNGAPVRKVWVNRCGGGCWKCWDVDPATDCRFLTTTQMLLCPTCGNKRCPKASDHDLACTNSNEPGQPGSVYR